MDIVRPSVSMNFLILILVLNITLRMT
ncbi:hypothetical protein LINPERPRIM_LOCUS28983 [Linum perenne]